MEPEFCWNLTFLHLKTRYTFFYRSEKTSERMVSEMRLVFQLDNTFPSLRVGAEWPTEDGWYADFEEDKQPLIRGELPATPLLADLHMCAQLMVEAPSFVLSLGLTHYLPRWFMGDFRLDAQTFGLRQSLANCLNKSQQVEGAALDFRVTPHQLAIWKHPEDCWHAIFQELKPQVLVVCPPTRALYYWLGSFYQLPVRSVCRRLRGEIDVPRLISQVSIEFREGLKTLVILDSPGLHRQSLHPWDLHQLLKATGKHWVVVDESLPPDYGLAQGVMRESLCMEGSLIFLRKIPSWQPTQTNAGLGYSVQSPGLAEALRAHQKPLPPLQQELAFYTLELEDSLFWGLLSQGYRIQQRAQQVALRDGQVLAQGLTWWTPQDFREPFCSNPLCPCHWVGHGPYGLAAQELDDFCSQAGKLEVSQISRQLHHPARVYTGFLLVDLRPFREANRPRVATALRAQQLEVTEFSGHQFDTLLITTGTQSHHFLVRLLIEALWRADDKSHRKPSENLQAGSTLGFSP